MTRPDQRIQGKGPATQGDQPDPPEDGCHAAGAAVIAAERALGTANLLTRTNGHFQC